MLKKNYIKAFFLSFVIALILLLPNIIKNEGMLTIRGDFELQQIPFNVNVTNEFKNGNFLYTFNNDLGSSIIEGYSFYNLANPFFLIPNLLPDNWFPYLIGILLIFKYALTGLFSYIYLDKFVKKKHLALLGSILYAFMGFQISNMFYYHFHDLVMLFPLFLYSIDRVFLLNKKYLFIFILAITILTNYVFAFGQLVFLIIYLVINILCKRYKITKKNILIFISSLLLGIGISMVILLPSAISVFNNPRMGNNLSLTEFFFYPFKQYIGIFQAFLIPPDINMVKSLVQDNNWASCEAFIPLFGLLLVFVYMIKNKKDYLSILAIVLIIFMFIPILNSSFTMFNSQYYARWYYMPLLIFIIMTIKVLDQKLELKKGIIAYLVIFEIYIFLALIYVLYITKSLDSISEYYIFSFILGVLSFVAAILLIKKYYKKGNSLYLFVPTIIIIIIMGYHYLYYTNINKNSNKQFYMKAITTELINDQEFYRVKYSDCMENMNLLFNTPSIEGFNSSVSPSLFKLYNSLNIPRKQDSSIENQDLLNFYSTKYIVSCSKRQSVDEKYKFLYSKNNYYVYYNKNYLKLGIVLYDYISNEDLKNTTKINDKIELFTTNYVIEDKDKLIINNANIMKNESKKIKNGVYSEIEVDAYTTVLYTVLYDKDFTIKVNGKKVSYFELNNGFIGINVKEGLNKVSIIYNGSDFKKGLGISILSLLLVLIWFIVERKRNIKNLQDICK